MSLREPVYSVLIVSASEAFNSAATSLLPTTQYHPTHTALSISSAKRAFAEREYDFVIVNAPLPDDVGTRFAIDTSNAQGTVVLLLTRAEFHDEIHNKVVEHGVFTLTKPTPASTLLTALSWMASAREKLRKSEIKSLSIEDKMKEIRIINRAKLLLVSELRMDEPSAHRYLEKQSMNRCISKRELAEEIINTYA